MSDGSTLRPAAWRFVEESDTVFDVVIADLPDPKNIALSKLYTRQFYGLLMERVAAQGVVVTQAGSPMFARKAFWSVVETLGAARNPAVPGAGLDVVPYHAYVPSFGEWGFALASPAGRPRIRAGWPEGLQHMDSGVWARARSFAPDMARLEVEENTVEAHPLVAYYLDGWDAWFR